MQHVASASFRKIVLAPSARDVLAKFVAPIADDRRQRGGRSYLGERRFTQTPDGTRGVHTRVLLLLSCAY